MEKVLVTGAAGFIGFHLSKKLLSAGYQVIGLDNLNDYYDVKLKEDRLAQLTPNKNFTFVKQDLANREQTAALFTKEQFDYVVNLAAQAGVRYSIDNPHAYVDSNMVGFVNVLEGCRHTKVKHLVYASSSSVYGANTKIPFAESDPVNHPISLYAASKKANELMAHTYSHLYNLPTTGLRFFTVYGPWGRPDMAYFKFANKVKNGEPIEVYNNGDMRRDFTYVDDIVEGVVKTMQQIPTGDKNFDNANPNPALSKAPYCIYNIGNNNPEQLMDMIQLLEKHLNVKCEKIMKPMQPGDVKETYADLTMLENAIHFKPKTSLNEGLGKFASWYKEYYKV